ncbi:MAG: hypothetical protein HDR04_19705 [Lachnospiraceae bacterium]|nr:hypothetical protein [Lachnospiraceae bacterium]
MRMTNKIMRNNSLYNINQNKILEDKLTNQMTNQSKIARPSDDPVVAIRALRLRSNVTALTQYYDKNASDADQWLTVTADALTTIDEVLTDLYKQATGAANKDFTADNLEIVLTQMKSLTKEFYSSGNVDYAGRYVFSGYRTDTAITFSAEDIAEMRKHPVSFEINEDFGYDKISTISYTDYNVLSQNIAGDGIDANNQSYEQGVTNTKLFRMRLSYNNIDSTPVDADDEDKLTNPLPITLTVNGTAVPQNVFTGYSDPEKAYAAIASGTEQGIAYIPSTGELVFSEKYYQDNYKEGDKFSVTYNKSDWLEGDINPVHYFRCTETRDIGDGTMTDTKQTGYNYTSVNQDIYYDVGFNQQIQVNTLATEVFTHDVQRDMDDFQHCLTQLRDIETTISDIEKKRAEFAEDSDDYKNWTKKLEAANKAKDYIRENIHTKFENQITNYQTYMNDNNIAITNNATRGSRLELISTRLSNQKATFKDLQTDNEGIDVTQVAVELSASELTYQAALMATGKIMETNLMNYI